MWNLAWGMGAGVVGTLLGPEESGRPRGCGRVWLLGASLGRAARYVRGWWWVGLLFEICIVDASIFMISTWLFLVPALGGGRGWWVGVVSV